jgi:hypothetical protein
MSLNGTPVNSAAMMPGKNGGMLRRGGPNGGAGGRRPDRIKRLAQRALEPRVRLLAHIADGVSVARVDDALVWQEVSPKEKIAAIETLRKIATGEQVPVHEVRARLSAQLKLIRQTVDADTLERLLPALAEVWK